MIDFVYLTAGLVLLVVGGEFLLSYSILFARIIRMSVIWISVVIISFGTSAPELVVSMDAAYRSFPDIALGNVIGSNIANTLLVLGAAAVIQPIEVRYTKLKFENYLLIFVFLAMAAFMSLGQLHMMFGALCIVTLAVYLWLSYNRSNLPEQDMPAEDVTTTSALKTLTLALVGLILLVIGAEVLVMGAVGIARFLQVSEAIISLSLVAIGTSLPELVTAVFAAYKGKNFITLANVVGSNLFNIMVVLGLTALIFPLPVNPQFMSFDMWILGGLTLLLFAMMLFLQKINRLMGVVLLMLYAGYITTLYIQNGIS